MRNTTRRPLAVFSFAALIAGILLANAALGPTSTDTGELARAGIEREGDIPLPRARA